MVVGNTTPNGATFVAKVDGGGPVRVAVADNASMAGPVFTSSEAVDAQGVAKVSISGLDTATRYWWQTEDNGTLDTTVTGQFRTHPPLGLSASFQIAVASCAGGPASVEAPAGALAPSQISDHPVFDTIRTRAHDEGWLGFWHIGDLQYYHLGDDLHGIVGGGSLDNYRRAYDDVLLTRQHQLYREVPWRYVWDDNDFDGNNSDGTFVDKANALQVYGERVPHGTLDGSNGVYQSWEIGRILFIASDTRYLRSPNSDPDGPSKTMLGSAQKTWMEGVLTSSDAEFFVWLMPSQWLHPSGADTWANFATERDELVSMLGDTGWLGRMCMVHGDRHALRINSAGNNPHGGFPILCAASLDSGTGAPIEGLGDVLDDTPGRNQYGTVQVTDTGSSIAVRFNAWRGTSLLGSHQFGIVLTSPSVIGGATVQEFAPIVAGSHDPIFEARVLTSFQTGEEPEGTELPIIDGDVQFDATAEVFATLQLTTQGTDPETGRSRFPRLADDPLGPYGNELFVRRGVDTGGAVLWSPLGYFRIETPEQPGSTDDPITIAGSDRMAGLIEGNVIEPREFSADTGVAAFFAALVGDVYPDALVVFDDDAGFADLGRRIVVDESRHEPLQEVVDGLGKVMFWDGQGRLRITASPDEGELVWTIAAGRGGAMLEANRRVTRKGAPNGVKVIGEGGGDQEPVTGVAIDTGPKSPTRWGGRYGKVLVKEQLPTVTTVLQAEAAARELLRRRLGAPHSADFGAVVNPGLRPRMPILVVHKDGNRDRHIVQTLTIPLRSGPHMTGTTRERTHIVIGNVIAS